MTTHMRNDIEQAAYEVGVATAKYDLLIANSGASITQKVEFINDPKLIQLAQLGKTGNGTRKRGRAVKGSVAAAKALEAQTAATKEHKAPVIARGVKKAPTPRAKGVKEAILAILENGPATTGVIIAHTNHKPTSINSTLMSLKKVGIVAKDDEKRWVLATSPTASGNGEAPQAEVTV